MALAGRYEQNRPMEPVTLTTGRLRLRAVGPADTEAVYEAAQDPDIQRGTTSPSPYLPEHARGFTEEMVPGGWAHGALPGGSSWARARRKRAETTCGAGSNWPASLPQPLPWRKEPRQTSLAKLLAKYLE